MTWIGVDLDRSLCTVGQYRSNPTFTGVTELIIGGGAAVNYATITAGGGCNLAIKITGGADTGIGYIAEHYAQP